MNLQRQEEILALLAAPVTGKVGQLLEYRDALMECRDHIDALEQTAAERVIADGKALAVVVPPLTPEWCDEIWRNAPRNVLTWAVIEWICKQDRERFRAIPADRVLGDGMVALRRFAERCAQRDHQPDEHIGTAKCVACEAEDALRASQGGASA